MTDRSEALWVVRTQRELPPDIAGALERLAPDGHFVLESAADWQEFETEVRRTSPRTVVAAGGDGTVQGVVRALGLDTEVALGVVPLGTGNDFARGLGLPLDPDDAVAVIRHGQLAPVDLLAVSIDGGEESIVVNAVTVGLSGSVNAELDEEMKTRWGRFAYLRAALSAAGNLEPFEATIAVGAEDASALDPLWSGRLLHVSFANGPTAGGGIPIAPNAHPADGRVAVCGVGEGTAWEIGAGVPDVLGEGEADDPWLLASVRSARLEMADERQMSVDGESCPGTVLAVRVLPAAVQVHLHASSDAVDSGSLAD